MRRLENAIEDTGIRTVAAGGGVAANQELRARLSSLRDREPPVEVVIPPIDLCMDNGAMVAGVGYHLLARGELSRWDTGVSARVAAFRGTA
jgi:N6-L-threonylcarbamoyladenine synthase